MNNNLDLFADGSAHSLPPHLDPAIVGGVSSRRTVDRDHVGENAVGRFGNNAIVIVVEVLDKAGHAIFAESFPLAQEQAAERFAREIGRKLEANRQQELFAE